MSTRTKISAAALAAVVSFLAVKEGVRYQTYRDIAGVPTICHGHTATAARVTVRTPDECLALLEAESIEAARGVVACVKGRPMTDGEMIAYTSFVYNFGRSAFCGSTMVKRIAAGDRKGACEALMMWRKYKDPKTGEYLEARGLRIRRTEERAFCLAEL